MTAATGHGRRPGPNRRLASVIAALAGGGLVHLYISDWGQGPGPGGWIVPLVCYLCLLIAAAWLSLSGRRGPGTIGGDARQPLAPAIAAACGAAAYFQAVLLLGIATATFVAVLAAIVFLSADRRAVTVRAIVISVAAALGFYLVFGRLAPIVLDRTLLF